MNSKIIFYCAFAVFFIFCLLPNVFAQECVDATALANYITQWKTNSTAFTMPMLMQKIAEWKSGTGCTANLCENGTQDSGELGIDCGGNCLFDCPNSLIAGIDLYVQGTPGKDYAVEWSYHDKKTDDTKVIYIKSNVKIGLKHNSGNRDFFTAYYYNRISQNANKSTIIGINGGDNIQDPSPEECFATDITKCDAGIIRYKIDRDEQSLVYQKNEMPEDTGPQANSSSYGRTPFFSLPFSFSEKTYAENNLPVLGTTGNNGQPYYLNCTNWAGEKAKYGCVYDKIAKRTNYGVLDSLGDEYHSLTFWDDGSYICQKLGAYKNGTYNGACDAPFSVYFGQAAADDGDQILFVINPKTPLISFKAIDSSAQFYTTPVKNYFSPYIFSQTTYLTDSIEIQLTNIMGGTVYYKIDNGTEQAYSAAINSNSLSNGTHTIEYWYGSNPHKTRKIIKNPDYPSKQETHPHNFFWDSQKSLDIIKQRIARDYYKSVFDGMQSAYYSENESDIFNGHRYISTSGEKALSNAFVAYLKGINYSNDEFARKAKKMLLDSPFLSQPVGQERQPTGQKPGIGEGVFYYQGSVSGRDALYYALTYDLIIGDYTKEKGYSDGFTPIEDIRARDGLAMYAKNNLQFATDNTDQIGGGGRTHWGASADIATAVISMTMTSYNSEYYGTSGFDGTPATHIWAPFPNYPVSWWEATSNRNTTLYNNPDMSLHSKIYDWILRSTNTNVSTPDYNLGWYDDYWGNVKPLYIAFSNIVHNSKTNFDLSLIDQKFNWYINAKTCDASYTWCKEFVQVNKNYSHAMNALQKIKSSIPTSEWYWWIGWGSAHHAFGISFFDDKLELCNNSQQDGYEENIDCGGSCPNACS